LANTLTEVLRLDCEIKAEEDGEFSLRVPHSARESAKVTLLGLKVQLQDYQVQYPENLRVTVQD
ncbi:MAG: ribosomal-processing cysteine protease Prp, partial [Clostridia bacterium]|nr:ribosomal-processing cysteine protease Prp [Clostridia bacterium]